jgi:hypothetical protein
MSDSYVELSHEGLERRDQILRLARDAARRRRRRRRSIAVVATVTLSVMATLMTMTVVKAPGFLDPHIVQISKLRVAPDPVPGPHSNVEIVQIQTDPTITARLALVPSQSKWRTLEDNELLQLLADAGRPSCLIEVDGRGVLLPRTVTQVQ